MVDEKQQVSNVPLGSFPVATVKRDTDGANIQIFTQGLSIPDYDYIDLAYSGSNLTGVVYKVGGSGGTTVGTLTLAYSGSNLISVTKS